MFSSSCTAAAAAAVAGAALAFHHQQRHRIAIFSLRASFAPSMAGSYSCCLSIYWLAVFWSLPPLSSLHPRFRASLFLRFALFSLLQFRRPADAPRSRFTFSVNLFFFFLHFYFFQEIFPCPDVFCFFFCQISYPQPYCFAFIRLFVTTAHSFKPFYSNFAYSQFSGYTVMPKRMLPAIASGGCHGPFKLLLLHIAASFNLLT